MAHGSHGIPASTQHTHQHQWHRPAAAAGALFLVSCFLFVVVDAPRAKAARVLTFNGQRPPPPYALATGASARPPPPSGRRAEGGHPQAAPLSAFRLSFSFSAMIGDRPCAMRHAAASPRSCCCPLHRADRQGTGVTWLLYGRNRGFAALSWALVRPRASPWSGLGAEPRTGFGFGPAQGRVLVLVLAASRTPHLLPPADHQWLKRGHGLRTTHDAHTQPTATTQAPSPKSRAATGHRRAELRPGI
jgi:hypothetical protein